MKPGKIAQYVYDLHWDALPASIRQRVRMCALDTLGAILAGSVSQVSDILLRMSAFTGREEQATELCSGKRVSLASAALINGFTANALDIDDGHRLTKGHPGAVLLPPILAAAEYTGASGQAFLEALACGYEVAIRAGIAWHRHFAPFYHGTGSWGAVAAAAACARILGLDPSGIQRAMGIAEYHAANAPVLNVCAHPSMLKDGIGWGCMTGILSALLAKEGLTASPCMLDGPAFADLFDDLGRKHHIEGLYFKPFCCCRWAQPAVTAALALKEAHGFEPEDILCIVNTTFREAATLSGQKPTRTDEAQYNIKYPVAAALIHGEVGPRQVLESGLGDEAVLALMDRIEYCTAEEYQRSFPAVCSCEISVALRDGRVLRSGPTQAQGDAGTVEDGFFTEKFRALTRDVLRETDAEAIIAHIAQLEQASQVDALLHLACKHFNGRTSDV